MILTKSDIIEEIQLGTLELGVDDPLLNPASVDLRIGKSIYRANNVGNHEVLDSQQDANMFFREKLLNVDECFTVRPDEFVLLTTREWIRLPNDLCARVRGKSSVGRRGLQIQLAGFVDPGFEGVLTLQLVNHSPFTQRLYEGQKICQMIIEETKTPCLEDYGITGQYQGGKVISKAIK